MISNIKDDFELKLEVNGNFPGHADSLDGIVVTPPIDEDFWLFRVPVSDKQALVLFPKFTIYGIGFQVEEADWNTNLPYGEWPERIYAHIEHNKGDDSIPDERCVRAIEMLQEALEKQIPEEYAEMVARCRITPRPTLESLQTKRGKR